MRKNCILECSEEQKKCLSSKQYTVMTTYQARDKCVVNKLFIL